jgi:hypothetical protein
MMPKLADCRNVLRIRRRIVGDKKKGKVLEVESINESTSYEDCIWTRVREETSDRRTPPAFYASHLLVTS